MGWVQIVEDLKEGLRNQFLLHQGPHAWIYTSLLCTPSTLCTWLSSTALPTWLNVLESRKEWHPYGPAIGHTRVAVWTSPVIWYGAFRGPQNSLQQKEVHHYYPAPLNLIPGLNPQQPFCFLPRPVFTKALGLDLLGLGWGNRPFFPDVLINQWLCLEGWEGSEQLDPSSELTLPKH